MKSILFILFSISGLKLGLKSNKKAITTLLLLVLLVFTSCNKQEKVNEKLIEIPETVMVKPQQESKIVNPYFSVKDLLGIWTLDNSGPHADFELTEKSFYVVDYDGNGNMPYEINKNRFTIYYPDTIKTGMIKKAANDSLEIYWTSGEYSIYVRWNQ